MPDEQAIIPIGSIEQSILLMRGQKVILDIDLAQLYGVEVKRLNEQVRRNFSRFPLDFMFQLTAEESEFLRSQFATLKPLGRGQHRKYLPYAFTEHGAIMAASVLNTEQAVKVSVFVVRAFVKLREVLSTHKQLAAKLAELESKLQQHDGQIQLLFDAIRELMAPPPDPPRKPIGFAAEAKPEGKHRGPAPA